MKTFLKNNKIRILLIVSLLLILTIAFDYNFFRFRLVSSPNNDLIEVEPLFAHVIFRHGERNIERTHPTDPYASESYWPGGYGALTKNGKKDMYELGKYLRRRYNKVIGEHYTPKTVYIHSTDYDRSLMSAEILASALFPPAGDQIWNKNLKWQPIPVHTRPMSQELLLAFKMPCPRFTYLLENYKKSTEYKTTLAKYGPLIKHWENQSGKSLEKPFDIYYLHDALYVEHRLGFDLPEWADEAIQGNKTLEYLAAFELQSYSQSTEMKKLEGGFVIKEMLDRFKEKSLDTLKPNRTLWIYSAHDLTFVNILNSLNVFDLHMPPYASSLHFELYKSGDDYHVQLFYRKSKEEILVPLEIPNCGTMCPLNTLYQLYKDILPTEFEDFNSACRHYSSK
ncbi:prostatic acid phosphatase-like [Contarinia nasturtii]|uniref:prostatic acid phosphatase-like n=1 Tax=Contarinia nasturtii TaxID=265458 RepID=UPI0012D3D998|nr:prostatic acid phosphatase-like [Contarinia nasturtii]